jgi:hypothetical protein
MVRRKSGQEEKKQTVNVCRAGYFNMSELRKK